SMLSNGGYDVLDNSGLLNVDHASLSFGEGWRINNALGGTMRATSGTISVTLTSFTNAGLIDLQSGSRLSASGLANANFMIAPSGSLSVGASAIARFAQLSLSSSPIANAGLINVAGGTFSTTSWLINNSGTIRASSGTV